MAERLGILRPRATGDHVACGGRNVLSDRVWVLAETAKALAAAFSRATGAADDLTLFLRYRMGVACPLPATTEASHA